MVCGWMLSAVVVAADMANPNPASPEAMVRTLASLVPAAVEGLIRDLVLSALASDAAAVDIADHAGCGLALSERSEELVAAGLAVARGDLILILRAGFAPLAGFGEDIVDVFERRAAPTLALLRAEPGGLFSRFVPGISPIVGVIGRRARLASNAASIAALARGAQKAATMRTRFRRVE